jgi:penicillin-binding protein 1A
MHSVLRTCRDLGFRTPLNLYVSTALGASEVRLLELANAYRAMASGLRAEPHVVAQVTESSGALLYEARGAAGELPLGSVVLIQEGLRGVIRLPGGTAHALSGGGFPIPVMGKTGTTSEFRDALFVGSTYGPGGITIAVRIGFDDNRTLGRKETGGRTALPIFREIMLRVYQDALVGTVPRFPREMEDRIDAYLATPAGPESAGPIADLGLASEREEPAQPRGDGSPRAGTGAIRLSRSEHRPSPMDRDRTID